MQAQAQMTTAPADFQANQFNASLLGCLADPQKSIIACCCPCVQFARNAEQLAGDDKCLRYFAYYCLAGVGLGWIWRVNLREKHGIDGTVTADFCIHCCCHCCALVQEGRELETRASIKH
ncbi:PLAC8 family-domain-containing protein [Cladochytrium replicatum]|nr:PLAC8 family-domain-containing protein [Cladochytrium replicatum]